MGRHSEPYEWPWWRPSAAWFLYGVGLGLVVYGVAVGVMIALDAHP